MNVFKPELEAPRLIPLMKHTSPKVRPAQAQQVSSVFWSHFLARGLGVSAVRAASQALGSLQRVSKGDAKTGGMHPT